MERILILCPTRARPDNVARLRQSLNETSSSNEYIDLISMIDSDDPKLVEYLVGHQDPGQHYVTGEPKRLGPWLNYAVEKGYIEPYDIVGFLGDDVISRTRRWDYHVRSAMQPNGIVYCNDGWQGENLPTGVFMDARMVEKAGYMVYPELVHLYIDNHWKAWGEALGTLTYLPDVLMEHMHPFAGKAKTDSVYQAANTPDMYTEDGKVFLKFTEWELGPLLNRIING